MAMCSLLGGIALANAKLGAVHGLAGVIGGTAAVPHGMACAALLAPVAEANVRALRAADAGPPRPGPVRRGGPAAHRRPCRGHRGRDRLDARNGRPGSRCPRLGAFGLRPEQAGEIAAKARVSSSMQGNPVPLPEETLREILLEAI